ncbi:tetratricopeptide repeat protein [Wolbachia endosymbiont (group B) of Carcina quercana]|uniref:tetratricopeptide repeat protein n=1 Tax=Wolbachia endosymbiont (group B) of Carcina quercana TaxID=2953992 RepID=UPI0022209B8A|nr:tetratricopeptide repeat protein [Wolbachia endosymbiont (group B) of Carcina quercana]
MLRTQHRVNNLKKGINSEIIDRLKEQLNKQKNSKSSQLKKRIRRQYNPDDINIAKLFLAIREHRTGNSELDKTNAIKELVTKVENINDTDLNDGGNTPLHVAVSKNHQDIVELLLNVSGIDVNIQNNQGNTPLHIAISKGNEELVRLLLSKGAKINIKNKDDKTPLDNAKQSNKEKIIKTLEEHLRKSSSQVERLSAQEKEVHEKLRKFVEDFVFIYERSLSEYYERLENQKGKTGKWADFANTIMGTGQGGTEGVEITKIKASSLVVINVLRLAISSIGSSYNRDELKKLIDQLYIFKKDPIKVREELVKSGVEIFQSFESQFVQVKVDGSWQRAMTKLAEDAVSRVVDYYRKNTEKEFSTYSITEGIVFGKSKKYKQTSTGIPHIKPGHTLESKNSNSWNTAELFDKAGLVIIKSDGSADKYYKRIDEKSDTSKYGYRLLFKWELENKIKKFVREYSEEKPPREEYRYVLKLDGKTNEEWEGELLNEINKQDPKLIEERLLSNFKEEMKQEAEKNFNELENFIDKNFNELSSYIESNQNEIEKVFSELMSRHQEASQKVVHSIAEGRKESRESFEKVDKKLDEIHSIIVAREQLREPIWFDVKKPVSLFTGRREELIDLHNKIQRSREKITVISQITSISGLGGIGKTELARQYVQEYSKNYYDNVIWINGESEVALIESFTRLAKDKLKIDTKDANGKEKDIGSIVEEVYNFFSNSKSLFIFDDAEESNYLNKFLPLHDSLPGGNGPYILITSRNLEWDKGIEIINLNELKPEEAIEFVKKGLSIEDESQNEKIEALVEKLKHFPLAIQQAIAYIEDQRVTGEFDIDDYLNEYEKKTKDLLNYEAFKGIDNDYAKTTFTTWKMTIDKIASNEKYGNLALRILDVISYLAPEKIRREVFLGLTGSSEEELRSAVRLLVKYSMVNGEQRQSVLSTHKLVQEVTRIALAEEGKSKEVMDETFKLLESNFSYGGDKLEDYLRKRELLPHLEAFLSHIDNWLKKNPQDKEKIEEDYLENLLIWISDGYFSFGNPKRQKELLERALPILEKHYGVEHFEVAKTLINLSIPYEALGDYEEAKDLLERALPILDYMGDHVEVAKTLVNLSIPYGALGDYQKAKELLENALFILEKYYGEDHFEVAMALVNLSTTYGALGDYEEAKELLERALPIFERHYGEDHFYVALVLANLGVVYEILGDAQRTKDLLERALPILEKHYGEDHFEVAIALENLAFAEKALGNHQRATELLERADKIYRKGKVEECLPSTSLGRRKREVKIGECELSWEDVDKFNTEKDEKRDFSKIKIDSEKFVNYIKDLPEEKHSQLIELAGKVQVKGRFSNLVDKLTSNQKVMNHLSRVKKISSITMHGMMVKNVLADFFNGDYQGVAINVGFIAGGQGFAKVAEAASRKGLNLLSEGKSLLGRSLRVASPFLARGTSAFVIYDLVNQIKAFKNSTEEALVGVIGDSIYLGVDSAEIGIEVAEVFEVLEGVSSVTGPIGAGIGAVVFVGTDVYMAVKRVENIDQLIHLNGGEKFIEGLRAFIGMQPEQYIEELMEEKQLYNQLVKQGFEYLRENRAIQSYVFPTGKSVVDFCREMSYPTSIGMILGYHTEECTTKFEIDLNSTVLLDRKRNDIKWSRTRPNDPSGGRLFCLPRGDGEPASSYGSYLCKNAIGLSDNKTEGYTLINLGEGEDYAKGFKNSPNIFVVNDGSKEYYGGNKNDIFVLQGDLIEGSLYGKGGIDTLDLTGLTQEDVSVAVNLNANIGLIVHKLRGHSGFKINSVERVLGRKAKADHIFSACKTKFLDGNSGSEEQLDYLQIESNNCAYNIQVIVRPYTEVNSLALKGNFSYIVPFQKGSASVKLLTNLESNHRFIFDYLLADIQNVDVKDQNSIKFNFFPKVANGNFSIAISYNIMNNIIYQLKDSAEIKVGKERNLYSIQSTNTTIDEIIKSYPAIANKLNMTIAVQSGGESILVGHGKFEALHNHPIHNSHLIGNGGENIYVITIASGKKRYEHSISSIPEVNIYNFDEGSSIDTLDLRNVVKIIQDDLKIHINLPRIFQDGNDLLVKLETEMGQSFLLEVLTIRLKDGLDWYENLHIISDSAPMKISSELELKPQPLIFEKDKEIIVVTNQDVEKGTELITPRKGGNYTFVRNNFRDLIITNAFDSTITKDNLCSITLSKFYKIPKMKALSIKFADKEIVLKDHEKEINAARDINIVKREHRNQVYSDVFTEVMMLSDQPHRHEHSRQHIRNRRSEYAISSGTRPSSWINGLFGWIKSSIGGFRAALPETSANYSNTAGTSQFSSEVCVSNNIGLGFFLLQSFLDKKYPLPKFCSVTPEEALANTLNIVEEFEKIFEKTAKQSDVLVKDVNFFKVYLDIAGHVRNESYSQIPNILYSAAKEACLKDEKFLSILKGNIEKMCDEQQMVNSNNQEQGIANVDPSSLLNRVVIEFANNKGLKGVNCAGEC